MKYDEFKPNTEENLEVHVHKTDEGKNSSGEGGVPDEGDCVVEDVCWVGPRVAGVHHIGPIGLSQLHLHKLGEDFI